MKNLLIALMVFGMCAMCEDVAKWLYKPYTEVVKETGIECHGDHSPLQCYCGDLSVSLGLDKDGLITSISIREATWKTSITETGAN